MLSVSDVIRVLRGVELVSRHMTRLAPHAKPAAHTAWKTRHPPHTSQQQHTDEQLATPPRRDDFLVKPTRAAASEPPQRTLDHATAQAPSPLPTRADDAVLAAEAPRRTIGAEATIPAHPLTRAIHFGGLGVGLAAGAAAAAVRRAVGAEQASSASLLLTEANVDRLAETLCRLRGAALKVGQMLSFNDAEVLPPVVRNLLDRVRDGADVMPEWQLQRTLQDELGDEWRAHLTEFEEAPIAAASIGQVHLATLLDGRRVALKVQYPGVSDSIASDLWSMRQLVERTGVVPRGLFLDRVLDVAREELIEECDYVNEAANTRDFKRLLAPYPEFSVPAVVPQLSAARVLCTEWMPGKPLDKAAADGMPASERDRVGARLLWLTLTELFTHRFMQTDPNWSNFLYDQRTRQLSLIDFGACRRYDRAFCDDYLRLVRACADGDARRDEILHLSHALGFLTGDEEKAMLDAHVRAATVVGAPFAADAQPFDFGEQDIAQRISADVSTMLKLRLTPPRREIYSLHRRLNGCFQLAARVGARIPARDILLDFEANHAFLTAGEREAAAAATEGCDSFSAAGMHTDRRGGTPVVPVST